MQLKHYNILNEKRKAFRKIFQLSSFFYCEFAKNKCLSTFKCKFYDCDTTASSSSSSKGYNQLRLVLVVIFFKFLELHFFCFVAAICDLVHDMEAIFHLP